MAFEFVDKNKKKLLVSFSSRGRKNFDLYKTLKDLDEFDILFLSDEGDGFYNFAIPEFSNNIDDTILSLRKYIEKYEYSIAIGSSMGGYAAVLFGVLCNFDKVVAITPQITLNPKFAFTTKKECKYHCLRTVLESNINTEIDIYIGNNVEDIIQTYNLKHCKLNFIDSYMVSFGHNILAELKDCGQLDSFIFDIVHNQKSTIISGFDLGLLDVNVLGTFYDLFLDKRFDLASSYIPRIVRYFRSPHMIHMAILCYLSVDDKDGINSMISLFPSKYEGYQSFHTIKISIEIYNKGFKENETIISEGNYREVIACLGLSKLMHADVLKIRLKAKRDNFKGGREYSSYYQIAMLSRSLGEKHDAIAFFLLANSLADDSSWIKNASLLHAKNLLNE